MRVNAVLASILLLPATLARTSGRVCLLSILLALAPATRSFADEPRPPVALVFSDITAWRSGSVRFPDVQVSATEATVGRIRVLRRLQSSDGTIDLLAPEASGARLGVGLSVTARFAAANPLPDGAYTDVVSVTIEQDDRDASQVFRFFRHFLVSQGKATPITRAEYIGLTTPWVEGFDRSGRPVRDVAGVVIREDESVVPPPAMRDRFRHSSPTELRRTPALVG